MFPEVHLNFDRLMFDRLYQFLLVPFIPGAVLVGGLVVLRPDLASSFVTVWGINPYVRLGIVVVAAYIVGWVLFGGSLLITGVATGIFSQLLRKHTFVRSNQGLWQRSNWRKLAEKFLGPELTPIAPSTVIPSPEKITPEQIGTSFKKNVQDSMNYNAEWEEWYNILQDYLLRDVPLISNDTMTLIMALETTGWAIIFLSVASSHARHWEFPVLGAALILIGILTPIGVVSSYLTSDRLTYWAFTARLLAEVRGTAVQQLSTSPALTVDKNKHT